MKWPILLLAFVSTTATAASDDLYADRPLDFRVSLGHHTLTLDYGGSTVGTAVDRIGLLWRERFSERLQLGLVGGYSFLTQTDNPATAGLQLNGYHAGFLFDLDLWTFRRTSVSLRGAWLYQKVDHDDGTQQVSISWREPSLQLGAAALVGDGVRVFGGLRYGTIDGEQRLSGTLNETRALKQTGRAGGFAGLELELEENGYVGVAAASGFDRSVSLYFGRLF